MQRISIVIVGSSHRDPASINLLRQHAAELNKRQVKLVSCVELPCDQTLNFKQELDQLNLAFAKRAIQADPINRLLQRDLEHAKPYFRLETLQQIRDELPAVFDKIAPSIPRELLLPQVNQIAKYILNYLALEESVLFDKEMQSSPYQGIERPMQDHDVLDRKMTSVPGFFQSIESNRMSYSADKILKDAISKAEGHDAIIICQGGALHTQRLAATIKQRIASQIHNRIIEVFPMICFSTYTADVVESMVGEILMSQEQDSTQICDQYQRVATPVITISENLQTKQFTSVEFDQVMSLAVAHVAPNKVYLDPELHAKANAMMTNNDIGVAPSVCGKLFSSCTML
jgi:hypothetical protein